VARPHYQHFTHHQTSAAMPPPSRRAALPPSAHGNNREDQPVRKTLIALTAATGLIGLGTVGATAAPLHPPEHPSAVQQADWYCGPRCNYWRHRHWEEQRAWRYEHRYPYYSDGYRPYGYGYHYYR
jgi:hypothetical protein